MAVGPPRFGRLRQRHQQGGFRHGQPLRLLAEPGERGRAHAFEIAAIGRQRQVAFEDLALGQPPLDLQGAEHLPQLAGEAAAFARLDQPRKLHRQRRAAGDDVAVAGELAGGAHHRHGIDARMVAEALVLVGDQHLDELRIDLVEADGSRQRPSGLAKARSSAPSRSSTSAETAPASQRRRKGAVERDQRRPGDADKGDRRAGGDGESAQQAGFRHRLHRASRRLDLHHAGRGAGRKLRPVHVLHAGRRMGVDARRHRAHDIGERDRPVAPSVAVEGGDEAVVAEFEMRRLGLLQPGEAGEIGAGDEARIVDLEAGRQQVGDQHARRPVVVLVDLEHDDEALVLRHLGDIGLAAVERVVGALDGEAVAAGRQRLGRRGDRGDHRLDRPVAGVGDDDRLVEQFVAGRRVLEKAPVWGWPLTSSDSVALPA